MLGSVCFVGVGLAVDLVTPLCFSRHSVITRVVVWCPVIGERFLAAHGLAAGAGVKTGSLSASQAPIQAVSQVRCPARSSPRVSFLVEGCRRIVPQGLSLSKQVVFTALTILVNGFGELAGAHKTVRFA